MPPKSRLNKVEFVQCEGCGCRFSNKDLERHLSVCQAGVNVTDFPHGFIKEHTLHGVGVTVEGGPEHLPKKYHGSVVLLHPGAMQLCKIALGGRVTITFGDKSTTPVAYTAWPNPTSALTNVSVVSSGYFRDPPFPAGAKVIISALNPPYFTATVLEVKLRDSKFFSKTTDFKKYITRHLEGRFVTVGNCLELTYFGQQCCLEVTCLRSDASAHPSLSETLEELHLDSAESRFYSISSQTKVIIEGQEESQNEKDRKHVSLDDIGGLSSQVSAIMELVELHFNPSQQMTHHGLTLPKGVLLYGPSGTGKTCLANAIAGNAGVHVLTIQGPEVWSRYYGESESRLRGLFQEAKDSAPCIIFIDEVDALCPRRETSHNEVEKRVVATLLTLMDDIFSSKVPVLVLSATNKRDNIDPALRRPGRFDREIEIGVPSAAQRAQILERLLRNTKHSLNGEDIRSVADQAHGFVGADLAAVCKEAGIQALKRRKGVTLSLTLDDILAALQSVQPSAMREVALEIPQVSWVDIGGQEELKFKLRQAIEWPLKHPASFRRLGIRPPRGLLMYGPPGCSKTMIAKALARESGINFLAIKGPELFSKWVGESERAVRELFRKARAAAPAIIFFDEIDSLAGERGSSGSGGGADVGDRVLAQLLTEIDGVVSLQDVTIVAATNRPDRIDKALLRPGRLDRIVYVPLPDSTTRQEIFNIQFRKTPINSDVDVNYLVKRTDGYSGAEVSAVCHEAALNAMQDDVNIDCVHAKHFEQALLIVTPRITPEMIRFYDNYAKSSGLHAV